MNKKYRMLAAAAFLFVCIVIGTVNNTYSIFLIPVTEDLGISRSLFGAAGSVRSIASMISNACFLLIYRKFGYRRPVVLFTLLTAAAYIGYACCRDFIPFYIGAFLFGIGESFLNTAGISLLISNWFESSRGKVLGFVLCGSGVGGSVLALVFSAFIEKSGWRSAMLFIAGIHIAAAALAFVFMKDQPSEAGLPPYRAPEKTAAKEVRTWNGVPLKALRKQPFFYLTILFTLVSCFAAYGAFNVFNAHLRDQGLSASDAAACYSVLLLCLAGAKIAVGAVRDRCGAFAATLLCLLLDGVGILMLAFVSTLPAAILTAVILAVGTCTIGFTEPLVALDLFGTEGFSAGLGLMLIMMYFGNVLVSPVINRVYDTTGSYTPMLLALAGMIFASAILFIIVCRMNRRFRTSIPS